MKQVRPDWRPGIWSLSSRGLHRIQGPGSRSFFLLLTSWLCCSTRSRLVPFSWQLSGMREKHACHYYACSIYFNDPTSSSSSSLTTSSSSSTSPSFFPSPLPPPLSEVKICNLNYIYIGDAQNLVDIAMQRHRVRSISVGCLLWVRP